VRCCGRREGVAVEVDIVEGAGEGREGCMKPPAESEAIVVWLIASCQWQVSSSVCLIVCGMRRVLDKRRTDFCCVEALSAYSKIYSKSAVAEDWQFVIHI